MLSAIIGLVIVCGIAAVALWAVQQLAPPDPIGRVVRVVVIVVALLAIIGIVATLFGVETGLPTMKVS